MLHSDVIMDIKMEEWAALTTCTADDEVVEADVLGNDEILLDVHKAAGRSCPADAVLVSGQLYKPVIEPADAASTKLARLPVPIESGRQVEVSLEIGAGMQGHPS